MHLPSLFFLFFFFNDTATTEIYTLSLHDALPILKPARVTSWPSWPSISGRPCSSSATMSKKVPPQLARTSGLRSEEHTSELQSRLHLVCRLLLEKKKNNKNKMHICISHTSYMHVS